VKNTKKINNIFNDGLLKISKPQFSLGIGQRDVSPIPLNDGFLVNFTKIELTKKHAKTQP